MAQEQCQYIFCLSIQDQAKLEQSQGSPRVAAGPKEKIKH